MIERAVSEAMQGALETPDDADLTPESDALFVQWPRPGELTPIPRLISETMERDGDSRFPADLSVESEAFLSTSAIDEDASDLPLRYGVFSERQTFVVQRLARCSSPRKNAVSPASRSATARITGSASVACRSARVNQ